MNKYRYRLTRNQREVTSEIVCQKHYDHFSQEGRDMAPLSDLEKNRSKYAQTLTPYTGERECETCADLATRQQKGTAA